MENDSGILYPLKRIAAIHDLSGLGKCSLTVALPVISAAGVECSCIPTALLSTHTGEFEGYTLRDLSSDILPIAEHWRREGAVFDGIYSGYLASPEQEKLLEKAISILAEPDTLIVVDPVMADNGEYYDSFDNSMCEAFRRLCGRADVITPNITEAALLTGTPYREFPHSLEYAEALLDKLLALGPKLAAVTGLRMIEGEIGMAVKERAGAFHIVSRKSYSGVFYGTGDLFASSFAALLVRGMEARGALELSSALVADSIERTVARNTQRRFGVDFEGALAAYVARVNKIPFSAE